MYTIYKIKFSEQEFYIGQTADFNRRRLSHLSTQGKGSPLLQAAFEKYAEPVFEVVEVTAEADIDAREIYWIQELQPTLNTLPGGKTMRGLNHPRISYTRAQILQVLDLFLNTVQTYKDIAQNTGVVYTTVHDICKQRSHAWASEGIDPQKFKEARDLRNPQKYIYSPHNQRFSAESFRELSELTGQSISTLSSIIHSKTGQGRDGWSATPWPVLQLTDPLGETYQCTVAEAKLLLEADDLSKYQKHKLLHGEHSAGWCSQLCS